MRLGAIQEKHERETREAAGPGQSLLARHITRQMLDDGTLSRYIDEFSITGLTSTDHLRARLGKGDGYDEQIATLAVPALRRRLFNGSPWAT